MVIIDHVKFFHTTNQFEEHLSVRLFEVRRMGLSQSSMTCSVGGVCGCTNDLEPPRRSERLDGSVVDHISCLLNPCVS